jgi:hypothetical protein
MGLFALPLGKTAEENVKEAIANLQLYLEHSEYKADYLLGFAEACIQEAKKKLEEKKV